MAEKEIFNSSEIEKLVTMVEEAARSTKEGVKHFVEPAHGTLRRAISHRHHLIFGRRGSGKSSLLQKAADDLTTDRRPIAFVNLESFKGHSYPDVLLSVLIATFTEFNEWLNTVAINPATKKSFWKLFGNRPTRPAYNRKDVAALSAQLVGQIKTLKEQLYKSDNAEMKVVAHEEANEEVLAEIGAAVKVSALDVSSKLSGKSTQTQGSQTEESFKRSKTDFLHRHIMEYQSIFDQLSKLSDGDSYLFLDDMYYIRRSDQANVLDYFHRIAKDHKCWLKIGTIRHRTNWYFPGDPPSGVKIGEDVDEIDLDLTLEKYSIAKEFLLKILTNFSKQSGLSDLSTILTDGALDRLVLASGGVARDFLSIFRRSVDVARERGGGTRGPRISGEDVNMAAGEYDTSKRQEFKRDTLEGEEVDLDNELSKLRTFCLDNIHSNCFLLYKDKKGKEVDLIHELVDLKFVHLVRSRVTVRSKPGQIFEAYMLDLSQYTGARTRRGFGIIPFWEKSSKDLLRRESLIYEHKLLNN